MRSLAADLRMLRRLLTEEQAALRDGGLARLQPVAARKAALIERLAAVEVAVPASDRRVLAEVATLARRNAQLIQAALAGLRDAGALLDRLRHPPALETYARDGTRQALGTAAGSLERRA